MTIAIAATCTACGSCIATCPPHALVAARHRPTVDGDRCTDCLACLEVCPVDAIRPDSESMPPIRAAVHPIEAESYRILTQRVDLGQWPDGQRDVVARMIHATADESFADSARIGIDAVVAAVSALRRGMPVVCDTRMVLAGIPLVNQATCLLDDADVPTPAAGDTRSAAAVRLAADRHPTGAVWVIGNAPTALAQLLELHAAERVVPTVVIGLPVGYVGAADAKAALWDSALRPVAITNVGQRGGSAVAAAAVNALQRLADRPSEPGPATPWLRPGS